MKNKKIFVLGGNGFVGKNLLKKLIKNNKLDVFATLFNKKNNEIKNVKYLSVDLRKYKDCLKITKNKDMVYICAATSSGASDIENNPLIHFKDNLLINLNVFEAAIKNNVKKIIFISSSTVYPHTKKIMSEKDVNFKFFPKYFVVGWMKLFSEISGKIFAEYSNTKSKILIVRPGNLYGPYDKFNEKKSKVIPSLIKKFYDCSKDGKKVLIWGNGKDIKNFIFIEDFIENLIKVSFKFKKNEKINIASKKVFL